MESKKLTTHCNGEEIALVTGGISGIGWQTVKYLLNLRNCKVILTTRDLNQIVSLYDYSSYEGRLIIFNGDISQRVDVQRLLDMVEKIGPVKILVNNASGWFEGQLTDMKLEEIDTLISGTLNSSMLVTNAIGKMMKKSGKGNIIFYGSVVGTGLRPSLNTAYNAAKWGVRGLAKTLRREFHNTGVKITLISFGMIIENEHEYSSENQPSSLISRTLDFILDAPSDYVIDEILLTPFMREY